MQEALLALNAYWTQQGCLVAQPMNSEVGAGTLNPATFLRVQGPEPWRVAYVEPSVRPDDSRYGENPNRLQTHTQFQVILKPEPGNAQELYLGSLKALGIDIEAHDVRFVEDNWASPALGAWGLGWEVWLDGLEITQFTYFQQAGGMTLDPVSVEITYGLERILMALQGVSHFKDIAYAPGITYGEVFGQAEYEMSRYYLDDADVETNRELFEAYAREARRLLDLRLPVPAYSYVLKCSHSFNVLDARGAISTTERARSFARMRGLAHDVAELWAERRAELGYPLGTDAATEEGAAAQEAPAPAGPTGLRTLAFEIGFEELPPAEATRVVDSVREALETGLGAARLGHGALHVAATPRRVVVTLEGVETAEPDHEQTVKGPKVAAAYDAEGGPTPALLGFARSQDADPAELGRAAFGKNEHVVLTRLVRGRPAEEVLAQLLPGVVSGLRAEKNMRWNASGLSFSRPIRWVLALLGDEVVPFSVSGLDAGRTTRVHRTAAQPVIEVPAADGYVELLARHGIIADTAARRAAIEAAALRLAAQVGGTVDLEANSALVDEIANLVEYPTPILGTFDEKYLELPDQILTTVMRKHQRYLPVQGADGALLPCFVTVANGACDQDVVRRGNEAVLRARYEDAAFFWRADLDTPLEAMQERLQLLTFEDTLGSMADRAQRIGSVATEFASQLPIGARDVITLERAAGLVKFDLGSQMVTELSSLAGVMAEVYARKAGQPEEVAQALFEGELPRHSADRLPQTTPGALLALADRADLLAGLLPLGGAPTGGSDPFGLRRAALGMVNILRTHPALAPLTVSSMLRIAAERQPVPVTDESLAEAQQFVVRRFEQQLLEAGHAVHDVRAVLAQADRPVPAAARLAELEAAHGSEELALATAAIQRVLRIVPAGTAPTPDAALFSTPLEGELQQAVEKTRAVLGSMPDLRTFLQESAVLVQAVDAFFEGVMVMDEDPAVRANRLALLATVLELTTPLLAWSELK
ncbi:glycine--tRNA ligase [Streptacidiphilus sp. MAP12-33]|uniref:glycine--tRNA ligase n=1 Tax=Streptacidiphilus sp. MAP12-33 TaxID=3156266 RepID=UPI0035162E13